MPDKTGGTCKGRWGVKLTQHQNDQRYLLAVSFSGTQGSIFQSSSSTSLNLSREAA